MTEPSLACRLEHETAGGIIGSWAVEVRQGRFMGLHAQWPAPAGDRGVCAGAAERSGSRREGSARAVQGSMRRVAITEPVDAALVIGSMQPIDTVDQAAVGKLGATVVRRRSGGGAVFVAPGAQLWIDFFVPQDDPLAGDLVRSACDVGRMWVEAIEAPAGRVRSSAAYPAPAIPALSAVPAVPAYPASAGSVASEAPPLEIFRGRADRQGWGRLACFASPGPGEVLAGGRKVVGMAGRRTRHGTWFQTMAPIEWDPTRVPACLMLTAHERIDLAGELESSVTPLPGIADPVAVLGAFLWNLQHSCPGKSR